MTATVSCPSCGTAASGRFCSSCGTTLAGAVCANCAASLTPGAKFCHRCGTPAGMSAPAAQARGAASVLPWAVAAISLVALIALVVGQRMGARPTAPQADPAAAATAQAPFANGGAMPRAPDISQMTPAEQAERLYDRIMRENEAGHADNVQTFMPMAVAAFEALSPLTLDQRYDLGRIGLVGRDTTLARAQSDTILGTRPQHLLGLILAAQTARAEGNTARARLFDARLVAAQAKELAAKLPEYSLHQNDIDVALAGARTTSR